MVWRCNAQSEPQRVKLGSATKTWNFKIMNLENPHRDFTLVGGRKSMKRHFSIFFTSQIALIQKTRHHHHTQSLMIFFRWLMPSTLISSKGSGHWPWALRRYRWCYGGRSTESAMVLADKQTSLRNGVRNRDMDSMVHWKWNDIRDLRWFLSDTNKSNKTEWKDKERHTWIAGICNGCMWKSHEFSAHAFGKEKSENVFALFSLSNCPNCLIWPITKNLIGPISMVQTAPTMRQGELFCQGSVAKIHGFPWCGGSVFNEPSLQTANLRRGGQGDNVLASDKCISPQNLGMIG